jgi:hypothetical protein
MTYDQWAAKHPQAARELFQVIGGAPWPAPAKVDGKSEAWAQQQIRLKFAHHGGMAWRNNVGATPAKCPDCGEKQRPIRYGVANDSAQLNAKIKSADIIGAIPRLITGEMVGTTIAQFASIEAKRPGWKYAGNEHETAQATWLALIAKIGGYATFSTGELEL